MYKDWALLCTVARCLFRDHLTIYVCLCAVNFLLRLLLLLLSLSLFNRLSFFSVCCLVLSVNFRWHSFCLLFVSVCTFEMFCYLAAVWKSVYLMVYFSRILTLIDISLVWFYASLRLKLARLSSSYSLHFGVDGKIFAFSLLSG